MLQYHPFWSAQLPPVRSRERGVMPYTPFILLTMARTGSTLLSRMLHQHSQIVSCDELFGENPRFSRQEYLRNLLLSASCGKVRPEHEELTDTHDLAAVSAPQLLERFLLLAENIRQNLRDHPIQTSTSYSLRPMFCICQHG